jgi:glyoxylase-like metal-dependent hydrolase (beta-lactamase superfamily II)
MYRQRGADVEHHPPGLGQHRAAECGAASTGPREDISEHIHASSLPTAHHRDDRVWILEDSTLNIPPLSASLAVTLIATLTGGPMPTLHRIHRLGIVNAYLVEEDDGLTLIDTGLRGMTRRLLAAAERLDRPIVRIALTHAHSDHVGSLDALAAALPGAAVIAPEREVPLMRGDRTLRPGEPRQPLRGGYPTVATVPHRTVGEGDRIGSLRVIATPGHTPGHVSFLDPRDGTLFGGDVFTNIGGLATSAAMHLRFPMATLATWSRELDLQSARRLSDLAATRLAPGHGPALPDPEPAMRRAIARAERADAPSDAAAQPPRR